MPRWLWLGLAAADAAAFALTYVPGGLETRGVQALSVAVAAAISWWLYRDAICWGWGAVVAVAGLQLIVLPPQALALRFFLPAALAVSSFLILSRRRRGWAPAAAVAAGLAFLPASFMIPVARVKAAAREKEKIKTDLNEGRVLLVHAQTIHDINLINEAAAKLQEAIQKNPQEWEAYRLLFIAAHDVGDLETAAPYNKMLTDHHALILQKGQTEDPLWYFTRLGYLALKMDDDQTALSEADASVDTDAIVDALGRMIADHDENAALIAETDAALAALPPEQAATYAELRPSLEAARSAQDREATTTENARFFLHKIVGYRAWRRAFYDYARGMAALAKKDLPDAISYFEAAVKESPLYAEPQLALAEMALARGDNSKTAEWSRGAAEALEGPGPTSLASRNELLARAAALHGTARWRSALRLARSPALWERSRAEALKSEALADLDRSVHMGVSDAFAVSLQLEIQAAAPAAPAPAPRPVKRPARRPASSL
jgi:hypothetical protein